MLVLLRVFALKLHRIPQQSGKISSKGSVNFVLLTPRAAIDQKQRKKGDCRYLRQPFGLFARRLVGRLTVEKIQGPFLAGPDFVNLLQRQTAT